jgi:hypothetical protein
VTLETFGEPQSGDSESHMLASPPTCTNGRNGDDRGARVWNRQKLSVGQPRLGER